MATKLKAKAQIYACSSREQAQKYMAFIQNPSFSLIGLFLALKLFDIIYGPLHLAFINLILYPAAHYG